MKREDILELCRKAPPIGQVKHEDFVDYIVVLEQNRRVAGEWVRVESAYMAVDGKIAMATLDHRLQGKRLDFEDPVVLVDSDEQLTLMVAVTSELYGRRHGIATSRKVGGTPAEQNYAWEVAETSAIGRALSGFGYGVLPGAGLASADDMVRALGEEREKAPPAEKRKVAGRRPSRRAPLTRFQRQKLNELYRELHGGDEKAAQAALETLFMEKFRHGMDQATYDEGAKITAQFLAEKRKATAKD